MTYSLISCFFNVIASTKAMLEAVELRPEIIKSSSSLENVLQIDGIEAKELSYNNFLWDYMNRNLPLVIKSTSNNWPSRNTWTKQNSKVNFAYLNSIIGNIQVPVANCSIGYYNSHEKISMPFHEYLNYWEYRSKDINKNMLYLKDWHLKALMPDYNFYEVPKFFASDWLNEYLIDKGKDDYMFVYMGPEGSWTPFHADVFSSFSWSTNILGLKKWVFVVPNEEVKLKDSLGNDPVEINESLLDEKSVKYFILVQHANESIFVPSSWYHQVWNLTDTISINHNWFNGCNVRTVWKSLAENMKKVKAEIQDCKSMENFEEHCQTMLKASFGMDYEDFLDILEHIGQKRLISLKDKKDFILFNKYKFNEYHLIFDLRAISEVSKTIKQDQTVTDNHQLNSRCENLLNICELYFESVM